VISRRTFLHAVGGGVLMPAALRELNYVEGRNITLEYRWAERMTLSLNITP
jgi:hypothetical protein